MRDSGEVKVGDEKQRVEEMKKSPGPKLGTRSSCWSVPKETFISNQPLPELLVTVSRPPGAKVMCMHKNIFHNSQRTVRGRKKKSSKIKTVAIKTEAVHIYHCHTACVQAIKPSAAQLDTSSSL